MRLQLLPHSFHLSANQVDLDWLVLILVTNTRDQIIVFFKNDEYFVILPDENFCQIGHVTCAKSRSIALAWQVDHVQVASLDSWPSRHPHQVASLYPSLKIYDKNCFFIEFLFLKIYCPSFRVDINFCLW